MILKELTPEAEVIAEIFDAACKLLYRNQGIEVHIVDKRAEQSEGFSDNFIFSLEYQGQKEGDFWFNRDHFGNLRMPLLLIRQDSWKETREQIEGILDTHQKNVLKAAAWIYCYLKKEGYLGEPLRT